MMRRFIKYILLLLVIGLLAYNSVYIKKLSEVTAATPAAFNAADFTQKLWNEKLPARLDSAVELNVLLAALHANPQQAFDKYSNALGIGNLRYCLIKSAAVVLQVNEDDVSLLTKSGDSAISIKLATEYIYGNAIRDASGLVDVKDFVNTMDLNNISEELNKQVRKNVLPSFKASVRKADSLQFTGVVELNKEHLKLNKLDVIPVQVKIIKQ